MSATTLQAAIIAKLSGDLVLTDPIPGGLGFPRIWNRWLKPKGKGATEDAWDGTRLLRNIVILEGEEVPHAGGGSVGADGRRVNRWPKIYLWAEAGDLGKRDMLRAQLRIEQLLSDWEAVTLAGRFDLRAADATAVDDDPQWPGNVRTIIRYQAVSARRFGAV